MSGARQQGELIDLWGRAGGGSTRCRPSGRWVSGIRCRWVSGIRCRAQPKFTELLYALRNGWMLAELHEIDRMEG
eukprot:SAG22_NODE_11062_length_502_cov_20.915633_1_plen_74_part_10